MPLNWKFWVRKQPLAASAGTSYHSTGAFSQPTLSSTKPDVENAMDLTYATEVPDDELLAIKNKSMAQSDKNFGLTCMGAGIGGYVGVLPTLIVMAAKSSSPWFALPIVLDVLVSGYGIYKGNKIRTNANAEIAKINAEQPDLASVELNQLQQKGGKVFYKSSARPA